MSKDIDGVDFVTDDNTGGYFVMECQNCGEVFNSKLCNGGESIADTGDYGDCYCPNCWQVDPMECDNANLVWNVQQKKINKLNQKCDELLSAVEKALVELEKLDASGDVGGWIFDEVELLRASIAKAKGEHSKQHNALLDDVYVAGGAK